MNPKKHYFARIPGIVLFILLAVSPWLSILLFILRAIDRDAEKKSGSRRSTPPTSARLPAGLVMPTTKPVKNSAKPNRATRP